MPNPDPHREALTAEIDRDDFGRELWLCAWMTAICWEEEAHTMLVHETLRDAICPICGEARVGPHEFKL